MASQKEQAEALLKPLLNAIRAFDNAKLENILERNKRVAHRPDPSIDRPTWERLESASRHIDLLRSDLNLLLPSE